MATALMPEPRITALRTAAGGGPGGVSRENKQRRGGKATDKNPLGFMLALYFKENKVL